MTKIYQLINCKAKVTTALLALLLLANVAWSQTTVTFSNTTPVAIADVQHELVAGRHFQYAGLFSQLFDDSLRLGFINIEGEDVIEFITQFFSPDEMQLRHHDAGADDERPGT